MPPTAGPSEKSKANCKRGPPSCGECVRLKLKCTRTWPCTNCVRRGCSAICPSGTLRPRDDLKMQKTVKALLAENEALKAALAARNEDAEGEWDPSIPIENRATVHLRRESEGSPGGLPDTLHTVSQLHPNSAHAQLVSPQSQSQSPGYTPPATRVTTLESRIISSVRDESHLAAVSGSGAGLMDWTDEAGRYIGRGAGALYVCEDEDGEGEGEVTENNSPAGDPGSSMTFPIMASDPSVLMHMHEVMPPKSGALALLQIYYTRVEWMYTPTDRRAIASTLETIYTPASIITGLHNVPPHRLATFLMALALGHVFADHTSPAPQAQRLFSIASALLTLPRHHFMVKHSTAAVECLHMMVSFLFSTHQPEAGKAAWPLLGTCIRIACAVGLHRDGTRWGLAGVEKENRERLWWECMTYDLLQSLNFGRPYSIPVHLSDCQPPSDPDLYPHSSHNSHPSPASLQSEPYPRSKWDDQFHQLKYRLVRRFVRIADCLASPELPRYDVVMQLDGELRGVEATAPSWLRWQTDGELSGGWSKRSFEEVGSKRYEDGQGNGWSKPDENQSTSGRSKYGEISSDWSKFSDVEGGWYKQENKAMGRGERWIEEMTAGLGDEDKEKRVPQVHMAALLLHKALLALHRPWFFQAIAAGSEPLRSPYAASFQACISSARRHTQIMGSCLRRCPGAAYSWWFFLFHAYTSAIVQAAVLLRLPNSIMADEIRTDFDQTCGIIEEMGPNSRLARRALPMLMRLRERLGYVEGDNGGSGVGTRTGVGVGDVGMDMSGWGQAPDPLGPFADTSLPPEMSFPQHENQVDPQRLVADPAHILLMEQLPAQYQDPLEWAGMDPLLQTLLHWNAHSDHVTYPDPSQILHPRPHPHAQSHPHPHAQSHPNVPLSTSSQSNSSLGDQLTPPNQISWQMPPPHQLPQTSSQHLTPNLNQNTTHYHHPTQPQSSHLSQASMSHLIHSTHVSSHLQPTNRSSTRQDYTHQYPGTGGGNGNER
ncbi:hypothetical protein M231_02995 [Tremella mesenterica]|uniref:Zn(2)-C6 fungal-type domain-containing protein n=1 Tax=Tremella mesenterica TaxID=5217 RepID=A0A4Q1BPV9_TREME|nr:hypothetical protein M231_02995 [Tremella mesenterica]